MNILKNKEIIAFDLDGTLAESKSPIDKEMSFLLQNLLEKKKVVVISGGSFNQFQKQFLPHLNIAPEKKELLSNLILLPTSGSVHYEFNHEKEDWIIIDKEEMTEEVKEKAISVLEDFIRNNPFGIRAILEGDKIIEDRHTQIAFSALGQNAPLSEKKKWDPDRKKRQAIKKILEDRLPEVTMSIGGTTTIDILPKNFDKAQGLIKYLNKNKRKKEELFFIGDAIFPEGNDYSVYEAGFDCQKVSGPKETEEIIKKFL